MRARAVFECTRFVRQAHELLSCGAQESEVAFIVLTGEEDGKELVKHKVNMEGTYQRQQGARVPAAATAPSLHTQLALLLMRPASQQQRQPSRRSSRRNRQLSGSRSSIGSSSSSGGGSSSSSGSGRKRSSHRSSK